MKKVILLLCGILTVIYGDSQNLLYAKTISGLNTEIEYSSAIDATGNTYLCGYFSGNVDFDPGPGTYNLFVTPGLYAVFISKLDASGNFIWAKAVSNAAVTNTDIPTDIALDAAGNSYVSSQSGTGNSFINKVDVIGNILWTKSFTGYAIPYSITVDASGNSFATGYFSGSVDFDPGAAVYLLNGGGIFITKLNSSGNFVWAKAMAGGYDNIGQSITLDATGNILVTGCFQNTVDFDPGPNTFNMSASAWPDHDDFVAKLNSTGSLVWAKQFAGKGSQAGYGIGVDAAGNVYTTGHFQDTTDFDPGSLVFNMVPSANWEVFVSKLNASGNFVWAKQLEGDGYGRGYSLVVDALSNVYVAGYASGTVDFDPGAGAYNLTGNGLEEAFVTSLDANGNFICAQMMGGPLFDKAFSVALDPAGDVVTTGIFSSMADFDPSAATFYIASLGGYDAFACKLTSCAAPLKVNEEAINNLISVFPNPSSGKISIEYPGSVKANASLDLKNTLGESVYKIDRRDNAQNVSIDLSSYPKGIYYIEMGKGEDMLRKKVVLQ